MLFQVTPLGLSGTFLYFDPISTTTKKPFKIGITLLSKVFDSFFLKAHLLLEKGGDGEYMWRGQFYGLGGSIWSLVCIGSFS